MTDEKKLSHYSKTVLIFMIVGSLLILSFNFYNYYKVTKNSPSDMWSKETTLGVTVPENIAKVLKEDDRILVTYQGKKDFVISQCDIYGKKIKDFHYAYDSSFIRNLMFFKKGSSYFLTYNYDNINDGKLEAIELNSDLKEVGRTQYTDVTGAYQINSRFVLFYHSGIMSCYDLINNTETSAPADNATSISGAQCGDNILITYLNNNDVDGLVIKDGKASDILSLAPHTSTPTISYGDLTASGDADNCFILYKKYIRGSYAASECVIYDFNTDEFAQKNFFCDDIADIKGCYSPDGAIFYGTMDRQLFTKHVQGDIVSFTLDDTRHMSDVNVATRQRSSDLNSYADGEYLVYTDYYHDNYRVNITSSNKDYIKASSGFKKVDATSALSYTLESLFNGLAYMVVIGSCWVIPSICFSGIGSVVIYRFNEKYYKFLYFATGIIDLTIKYYFLRKLTFYQCGVLYCPFLTKPSTILIISVASLVITSIIHYANFNNNKDHFLVTKLDIPIILDSILSLILFIPIMP